MHDRIEPVVFQLAEDRHAVSFRIQTRNIPGLIAAIKDKYRSLDGSAGHPFVYSFMDDDFNKLYESDQRMGRLFISFTVFTIFIACLGLFGLVTYVAEQRTREIGIRKVLGATVNQIVGLLSADFLKLVALAAVIACPIAGWATGITLLTVCFRAIRAATVNPVKSLRTE
jgi:putative ABC transport system permease protein